MQIAIGKKTLNGKEFIKSVNIFPHQNFALYGILLVSICNLKKFVLRDAAHALIHAYWR